MATLLDDEDGTFVVDLLEKAEKEYRNGLVDYLDESCLSFIATLSKFGFPEASTGIDIDVWESESVEYIKSMIKVAICYTT